jgi:hypothetical protein
MRYLCARCTIFQHGFNALVALPSLLLSPMIALCPQAAALRTFHKHHITLCQGYLQRQRWRQQRAGSVSAIVASAQALAGRPQK